jgi:hypothetical protein
MTKSIPIFEPKEIISIDPHTDMKNYYVSVFDDGGKYLWSFSKISIILVNSFMDRKIVKKVLVEGQYVGPNKKNALELAASRGAVAGIATINGIEVEVINPLKWSRWIWQGLKLSENTKKSIYNSIEEVTGSGDGQEHIFATVAMFLTYKQMTVEQFISINCNVSQ